MKKFNAKASLLVSAAAVAGLAIGATVAMAAHQPIPLYTYEEVAAQMTGTNTGTPFGTPNAPFPVIVDPKTKQGMPYSPKATCSGGSITSTKCHADNTTEKNKNGTPVIGYTALADHAFHAALGYNEWMDNSNSGLFKTSIAKGDATDGMTTSLNPQKPWLQSHGHNGKW